MTEPKIKLTHFRKSFNIPSDFIRSTCKVLNLEILKVEDEPVIPLYNQILQRDNDTILLYAFIESKLTGKIETTKRKEFNEEEGLCLIRLECEQFVWSLSKLIIDVTTTSSFSMYCTMLSCCS